MYHRYPISYILLLTFILPCISLSETVLGQVASKSPSTSQLAAESKAKFQGIGDLPGGEFSSSAAAISSDGNVVVGNSVGKSGTEAFRWTEAVGIVGLGDLPGGKFKSTAADVNSDGSIVVGSSDAKTGRGFVWTSDEGMQPLDAVYEDSNASLMGRSSADAISDDGGVIVGSSGVRRTYWFATMWNQARKPRQLPGVCNQVTHYFANGISSNGRYAVGSCPCIPERLRVATKWDFGSDLSEDSAEALSSTDFPPAFRPPNVSWAALISDDGKTTIVKKKIDWRTRFSYLRRDGEQSLQEMLDYKTYRGGPNAMTANASLFVGTNEVVVDGFWKPLACIWFGPQDFKLISELAPPSAKNWKLSHAIDISADGRTIIGNGTNPEGKSEAWILTLEKITNVWIKNAMNQSFSRCNPI